MVRLNLILNKIKRGLMRLRAYQRGDAMEKNQDLLTPAEVAVLFRVDPKTVTRWAKSNFQRDKYSP